MTAQLDREHHALRHLRIVEVSKGIMAGYCGRLFADLGAQVRRVDASAGSTLSEEPPLSSAGESLLVPYLAAGKQTLALDPTARDFHARLDEILRDADILIEDSWPGKLFAGRSAPETLRARHPHLVVISLSPFGRTGPYKNWAGGELCGEAFGGFAYLTGQKEEPPLKLAGNLFQYATAVRGFTGGLAALQSRRRDGAGRVVDVSLAECVASKHEWTCLYTSLGLILQRSPLSLPFYYPYVVFPCADGFMEIGGAASDAKSVTAAFLGDESVATDPRFDTVLDRAIHHREFGERIRAGIRDRKRAELFDLGSSLGMLCGPVSTPEEVGAIPQLEARDFWKSVKLPDGSSMKVPGSPIRLRTHPRVRERAGSIDLSAPQRVAKPSSGGRRPLEGVRVIDFTVAWAGPMATRVLAELGADVIRIGSFNFRHMWRGLEFAAWPENDPGDEPWNRQPYYLDKFLGKREVALDVTQPRGRELLERLLAVSDIFIENHSPRALANMGLTYETLAEKFPHLIMVSSSGFGQEGPWGPRSSTGDIQEGLCSLSYCTGYPGGEPERAGTTVLDAGSGAVGAAAVLAALEYRAEHGHGVYLDQSLLETGVALFPEVVLATSAGVTYPVRDGSRHARRAPHDFFPCQGDDQWIAIDVDSEAAWASLARALDRAQWLNDLRFASAARRVAHRDALNPLLAEATSHWDKTALAEKLQQAGVAAAPALDLRELVLNPHLRERGLIQKVEHPLIGWRTWTRNFPGRIEGFDLSIPRAAPLLGEHNEEVLGGLLGIPARELEQLERERIIAKHPGKTARTCNLDPERFLEYPGIREHDPLYRQRLGLDE